MQADVTRREVESGDVSLQPERQPSTMDLSAANDLIVDAIVQHLQCLESLMRLRTVSKATSRIVTSRLRDVGVLRAPPAPTEVVQVTAAADRQGRNYL